MPMPNSPDAPQPLGRVVNEVKGWVGRLGAIWVDAQVIELRRRAGAATHFLKLRDRYAEVSATVTCSGLVLDSAGPITEGVQVVAQLKPRVWEKTTSLTFECLELRIAGEGRLLAELEQRKRLLMAEGLFEATRKKRLPFQPNLIGLIAGEGSDAARDVMTHVTTRWPAARLRHVPAKMQGPGAAESVMVALRGLEQAKQVDVIVIARGGGSLEDLLPFSDEGLVRAVAACRTPVVSAIGHEADSPILDLVADRRASTPTDAAKYLVPDAAAERELITRGQDRLRRAMSQQLDSRWRELSELRSRPAMRDPMAAFAAHDERLGHLRHRLDAAIDRVFATEQLQLRHQLGSVRNMSPKATLERGYTILVGRDGQTIADADQVTTKDRLTAHLARGQLGVTVNKVSPPLGEPPPPPRNLDLTTKKPKDPK